MKRFVQLIMITTIVVFSAQVHSMQLPEDDIVVNSIKQESNLTQSDVDRWKFLWMRGADWVAAGAGGLYAAAKGQELVSAGYDKLASVFSGENVAKWVRSSAEVVPSFALNQTVWASAGTLGGGYLAYKVLYPRIRAGLMEKVQAYATMCKKLAVTQYLYNNINDLKTNAGNLGNSVWSIATPIALDKGVDNLLYQQAVALLLLDQLGIISVNDPLRKYITDIRPVLEQNKQMLQQSVATEYRYRAEHRDRYLADLKVQAQEISITGQHIKNVTGMWNVLKDVGRTGYKLGGFAYQHKEALGIAALSAYLHSMFSEK